MVAKEGHGCEGEGERLVMQRKDRDLREREGGLGERLVAAKEGQECAGRERKERQKA